MATQDPGSTTIKPLTPDTWNLFAGLVERHNGIFGGCWCVKFHPERADHVPGYDGNRAFKRRMVEEGTAHAALVVRDGEDGEEAIAWAEYGTPAELPDIHHSKQ
ncbi:MAG TPA: GNAT family N-acetyltransferase, partial [Dermatophilaceae bacterium]|nr:GNAT family N-acetyltransferase [Dermatophilaceae bacterium]